MPVNKMMMTSWKTLICTAGSTIVALDLLLSQWNCCIISLVGFLISVMYAVQNVMRAWEKVHTHVQCTELCVHVPYYFTLLCVLHGLVWGRERQLLPLPLKIISWGLNDSSEILKMRGLHIRNRSRSKIKMSFSLDCRSSCKYMLKDINDVFDIFFSEK